MLVVSVLTSVFVACKKDTDEDKTTTCTCRDSDGDTYTVNPADYGASNCGALATMASGVDGDYHNCW